LLVRLDQSAQIVSQVLFLRPGFALAAFLHFPTVIPALLILIALIALQGITSIMEAVKNAKFQYHIVIYVFLVRFVHLVNWDMLSMLESVELALRK